MAYTERDGQILKKRLKLHTRIFIHMQTWCISGGQWALILLQKEEGTLVFLGKAACVLHVGDASGSRGQDYSRLLH